MAASRHDQHIADMFIASWLRVLLNSTGAVRSQGSSQGKRNIERQGIQRDEFNMTPFKCFAFVAFNFCPFRCRFFFAGSKLGSELGRCPSATRGGSQVQASTQSEVCDECNRSFLEFNSLTMFKTMFKRMFNHV